MPHKLRNKSKAELAQNNDIQAISKKYTGNGVTVQSADMGLRNLTDIPAGTCCTYYAIRCGANQ